jgi:hypothetical protein
MHYINNNKKHTEAEDFAISTPKIIMFAIKALDGGGKKN